MEMSGSASKIPYLLTCDELRLSVEFSLSPGVFGRVGSSPDIEISLPLVGLADEECRIGMDEYGLLWLTRAVDDTPIRIDPPAYFHAGPYRFLMREMPPTALPSPELGYFAPEIDLDRPRSFLASRKSRTVVAATTGLLVLAGASWFVTRPGYDKRHEAKIHASAPTAEEPPTPPATDPVAVSKDETEKPEIAGQATKEKLPAEPQVAQEKMPTVQEEPERIDLEKLATKVAPCVFRIEISDASGTKMGTGTGFSVSSDGLVATNFHVIENGHTFSVVTNHGARFERARVVVEDPASDLALLKIDGKDLPFLTLAKTSEVPVGKRVAVLGSPQGLSGTLSEGIISAPQGNLSDKLPGRELPNKGRLIQTTAAISPGSSGSPLFDGDGKVLGVMTMIFRGSGDSQNLNFGVPVEALRRLVAKPKSEWLVFRLPANTINGNASGGGVTSEKEPLLDPKVSELLEKMDADEWVGALKIASGLAEKYPTSAFVHFKRGYCASMLRLDKQAETSYRKVVEISPTDHIAWNNLGVVIRSQELYPQALEAFEKSVALEPDFALAWDNLLITNVMMENWAKATTALETLSKLDLGKAQRTAELASKLRLSSPAFRKALADTLAQSDGNALGVDPTKFRVIGVPLGDMLSVRAGPGSNFPKLDAIANGNEVFVVGESKMNGETEWIPIEYGNFSGWVASKFLTEAE